jgi:acetolactate synthase-1/2/3 large subunit
LTALLDAVGRGDAGERSEWLEAFDTQRAEWRAEIGRAQTATDVPLTTESVLHEARGALPANTSVVAGIGPRYLIAQHFPVSQPGTHFAASGSGTMGFAVPGALGVKLARPNDPVVCICGDGEVKSTSQAIATAVEYQIPVIWIILNNYSYNVIELYQSRYYGTLNGSVFTTPDGALYSPDYCRLAEAYGALGEHVRKPGELTAALGRALQADRPYLIEVEVSRRPKLRASGFWEANRYLRRGWNLEARDEVIGGFGDAGTPKPWRRRWGN